MYQETKINWSAILVLCVIVLALLLRVMNLDADPSALMSRDFITDEGWWAHNARNAFFYGQWRIDQYNLSLYSASFYNLLLYSVFKLSGVSFTSMRMLSAMGGWLTVVVLFLLVRRELNTRAAIFASVMLGFSNLHIVYSRTGFTEGLMVFFLALTLWLWSLRRKHYLFALLAGISLGFMVAAKITAVYLFPGLALVSIALAIKRSTSRKEALLFLAGAALVAGAYGILVIGPDFGEWLRFNVQNGSGSEWSTRPSSLLESIPRLLGSQFYAETPVVTALTALALCTLIVGVANGGIKKTIRDTAEIELISAILLVGLLLILAITRYQPERRFLPALLLMTILSTAVLNKGCSWLEKLREENYRMHPIGWFAVLFVLPSIGILELRWRLPNSIESLALKLIMIVGLAACAVALSRGFFSGRFSKSLLATSRLLFIVLFSFLSISLMHKALLLWGLNLEKWRTILPFDHKGVLISSVIVLACSFFVQAILRSGRRTTVLVVGAFLLIEAVQISSWLFQPTYTLKEANTFFATTLTRDDTVVTYYETPLLSSAAEVICRSARRSFNVDAFDRFNPDYTLVLRRDNWKDYALEDMPIEEWPPPANLTPERAATFELCPTKLGGPRFIIDLYRLRIRTNSSRERRKMNSSSDTN